MSEDPNRRRPWIVLLGGFLGSGKTTLILAAVRLLEKRGLRCAVILNDQSNEMVDMRHAEVHGMLAREMTGGCFCCRFSELLTVIEELREALPDVIFAEPVGSCTDIVATVLGPLREEFDSYRVAPFTVLVDPARAIALRRGQADPDVKFLFQKQLEEADLVCMTKADLYPDAAGVAGFDTRHLSAKSGQGVAEWLNEILLGSRAVGRRTLEIDYARYAQAEAALAWLNLSFILESVSSLSPALTVGPLLERIDGALTAAGIPIVHLKLFDTSPSGWLKAGVCANGEQPSVEGSLDASPSKRHELLVNLRAKGDPGQVRKIVEDQVRQMEGRKLEMHLDCFRPAPPRPERRRNV